MTIDAAAGPKPGMGIRPDGRVRLSWGQSRLWMLDQIDGPNSSYNDTFPWRLTGPLDRGALAAALADVVARHTPLRTVVDATGGEPSGRLVAPPEPDEGLAFEDLSSLSPAEKEHTLDVRLAAEASQPFDLSGDRLLRALLLRLSANEHVLCLVIHHCARDRTSNAIFYHDLDAAYEARRAGRAPAYPDLPITYADYAAWVQDGLERSGRLDSQVDFWRRQLADAPTLLALPTDHPRTAERHRRIGVARIDLEPALTERLKTVGRRQGASLFRVFLAALGATLGRLAGAEDIVIGVPASGRGRPETRDLVGFFVNTLPLRIDLSGRPGVATLIERARLAFDVALAHQDVPFERLVEELAVPRTRTHTPLVQVLFNWLNQGDGKPALTDIAAERIPLPTPRVKVDIEVRLTRSPDDRIGGVIEYDTSLFEADTIRRWGAYFLKVLEGFAGDVAPGEEPPAALLPIVDEAELNRLVNTFNATAAPTPDRGPAEAFAAQADHAPRAIALVFQGRQVTYAELDAAANRLAHHLLALGVGPETVVGVALDRGEALVVALLAILKAGAAYLPLDPTFPDSRLKAMVKHSGAALIVTDQSAAGRLAGSAPAVCLDDPALTAVLARRPSSRPTDADRGTPVRPETLAYVIYTSGSTGRPKGVGVPLGALAGLLADMKARLEVGPSDAVLGLTTIAFDIAALEIFLPLISGARLVLADAETARDPVRAMVLAREAGVSVIQATPSHWRALLEAGAPTARALVGGEALPGDLAAALAAAGPAVNLYGPTETTVWSAAWPLDAEAAVQATMPIGVPIANTRIHVLDRYLTPAPTGVAGELYIAGAGLARGYWRQPGLTAERFVASPFGPPGARLYRTGDLARWRPDGVLEFLGRADRQIKLRGFRIEPAEIEAALLRVPGVGRALAASHGAGAKARLVAYLTPAPGATVPAAEVLRATLAGALPDYMVPAAFTVLTALPLTPSGKVDLGALPAPAFAQTRAVRPPRNETERTLLRLFAQTTGAAGVGVDDNFFEIGGHSLLGVRLMFELERAFGHRLRLEALFDAPTVAGLAARLARGEAEADSGSISLVRLQGGGTEEPLFMVHWIEHDLARRLGGERPVHGLSFGLAAGGDALPMAMPETVEGLAAHYVEEMRRARPHGPYHLIGHSAGGVVAFEMAQQLRRAGAVVGLVGLMDSYAPEALANRRRLSLVEVAARIVRTSPRLLWRIVAGRLGDRLERFPLQRRMASAGRVEEAMGQRPRLLDFVAAYAARPYPGAVHIFKSSVLSPYLRTSPPPPPERHWRALATGGLHVRALPGGHLDMIKDPLAVQAAEAIVAALNAMAAPVARESPQAGWFAGY